MEKIWYILVNRQQEGPYSFVELSHDKRLTPKTYVWREGLEEWVFAEELPELKAIFEKEETVWEDDKNDTDEKEEELIPPNGELTLQIQNEPPYYLLWILIAIILFATAFFVQYL